MGSTESQKDSQVVRPSRAPRIGSRWFVLTAGALGAGVLAWTLGRVGFGQVLEGIRNLGWVFPLVVGLGGLRFAVRALAWMMCVQRPARLAFRDAFAAFLAGDALGTLSPLGLLASEPTKVLLTTARLPPNAAVSSVAIENILYSFSVALMIATGGLVFLRSSTGTTSTFASESVIAGFVVGVVALVGVATTRRRPVASLTARLAQRWPATDRLTPFVRGLADLESRVFGFATGDSRRWIGVFGLETAYHVIAVLEVWVTLSCIVPRDVQPTLLHAFLLESMNRFITVVFKFVPLRVGVDEAGTGFVTSALALGPVPGVTLALIRKARILCWTAAGIVVLFGRGWWSRSVRVAQPERQPRAKPDTAGGR